MLQLFGYFQFKVLKVLNPTRLRCGAVQTSKPWDTATKTLLIQVDSNHCNLTNIATLRDSLQFQQSRCVCQYDTGWWLMFVPFVTPTGPPPYFMYRRPNPRCTTAVNPPRSPGTECWIRAGRIFGPAAAPSLDGSTAPWGKV